MDDTKRRALFEKATDVSMTRPRADPDRAAPDRLGCQEGNGHHPGPRRPGDACLRDQAEELIVFHAVGRGNPADCFLVEVFQPARVTMIGFFIQRILQALLVIIAMSVIVFVGVYAIGNPIDVMIDPASDQALRDTLIQRYGFDRPLIEQYFIFMGNMLRGDLGESFHLSASCHGPDLLRDCRRRSSSRSARC